MRPSSSLADAQTRALGVELAYTRHRGVGDVDLILGHKHATVTPLLDWLAYTYADDWETARSQLIRHLLIDALAAWKQAGHQSEADLVHRLFFAPRGTEPTKDRPGPLLDAARKASGRRKADFEKHRRAVFRQFAHFLIQFVTGRQDLPIPLAVAASPPSLAVTSTASSTAGVLFRFDALGGGSSIIRVFPGVQDTPADRLVNGTFADGQTTTAFCKTTGRPVRSNPSVGERPRESNVWLQVLGQPGKTSYATLTYGDIDPAALARLPQCRNVP